MTFQIHNQALDFSILMYLPESVHVVGCQGTDKGLIDQIIVIIATTRTLPMNFIRADS